MIGYTQTLSADMTPNLELNLLKQIVNSIL